MTDPNPSATPTEGEVRGDAMGGRQQFVGGRWLAYDHPEAARWRAKGAAQSNVVPLVQPQTEADLQAQQGVLGCALYEPGEVVRRAPFLSAHHFGEPAHAAIFEAVISLQADAKAVSLPTVADRISPAARKAFEELGGFAYLADLIDKAPPLTAVADLAGLLTDQWAKRELAHVAAGAIRAGSEGRPATDVIAELKAAIDRLEGEAAPEPTTFVDAQAAALAMLEEKADDQERGTRRGVRCGLDCIDKRLGGFQPGTLVVLGGRPSMGKTALMRSALYGAGRENPDKLFALFSLEMDAYEVSERAVSEISADSQDAVETDQLHKGLVETARLRRLYTQARALPSNVLIDSRSGLSVDDVRRAVWALKRKGDLALVAIDYLQLMRRPAFQGRNDAAVVGEMTRALKVLARDAGVCILLLSQLSRGLENREDKRPTMADLRESGSIEQDANVVLFAYRESYYLERAEPKRGTPEHLEWEMAFHGCRLDLDVICGKNRQGSIGTDRQRYDAAFDRITNLERF